MNRGRGRTAIAGATVLALIGIALATSIVRPRTLHDETSSFGRIRVVEERAGIRVLITGDGRARQTAIDPARPGHLQLAYTRTAMIGPALAPDSGAILFVGLGGGAMPTFTRRVRPDLRIVAAEIDPAIVRVAQDWFGFRQDDRMHAMAVDGRALIENRSAGTFDVVLLDAFSDDEIPASLTTVEFLTAVHRSLNPGGVVVSNLWTGNPLYASMVATYRTVFGDVVALRVPGRPQVILLAAGDRALDVATLHAAAARLHQRAPAGLSFDLPSLVRDHWFRPESTDARVLYD